MDTARSARLRSYAAQAHAIDLSDDCLSRLDRYVSLLAIWNRTTRLTGSSDEASLVEHHVADSLATVSLAPPGGSLIDIGSGAGFPGIVIQAVRTDTAAILVEPRRRRASFLSEVVRTLPLPQTTIVCARAEEPATLSHAESRADLAVSRALRMDVFLSLAHPLLRVGGIAVAMQAADRAPTDAFLAVGLAPLAPVDYRLPDGSPAGFFSIVGYGRCATVRRKSLRSWSTLWAA